MVAGSAEGSRPVLPSGLTTDGPAAVSNGSNGSDGPDGSQQTGQLPGVGEAAGLVGTPRFLGQHVTGDGERPGT